jgi:hypothetical protein
MRRYWIFLLCSMAFAFGGCAASPTGTGDSQNPPSVGAQEFPTIAPLSTTSPESSSQVLPVLPTQGENTPMAPTLPTPYDPGLQSLIEKAREDLAKRFSIPTAEIGVVQAFDVVWPDSGLGCSQTGMASAQVLTPGYLILLKYSDNKYEYHADKGTYVTYCINPTPPILGAPDR